MTDEAPVQTIYIEPAPRTHQEYLGDGLYAEFDGYQIWLFTHDGYARKHEVALEPQVLTNFLAYIERLKEVKP
jgi:hypothetical protein